jgi:hypothetical protein
MSVGAASGIAAEPQLLVIAIRWNIVEAGEADIEGRLPIPDDEEPRTWCPRFLNQFCLVEVAGVEPASEGTAGQRLQA